MPPPFKQIDREQFAELVQKFDFKRKIDAVHMHHTWRPNHSQYDFKDGHKAIQGMYFHHTQVNKWQDIAQHITIAPDGSIWLGRHWNLPPASASGHNGNSHFGPFMFEIIGDFDVGRDSLEGEQYETVVDVIAQVQRRFALPVETLRFHNSMSTKSCPGTSIKRDTVLADVTARLAEIERTRGDSRSTQRGPFGVDDLAASAVVRDALDWFPRDTPAYIDAADAEPGDHHDEPRGEPETVERSDSGQRALTPGNVSALRAHLINLNGGHFSRNGDWKTDAGEVDSLFDSHLQAALEQATQDNRPFRLVLFCHGGLVSESAGLQIALKHRQWWLDNQVYPIYFIWETGLFETLGQLLRSSQTGARDWVSDHVTDPMIETIAHSAGGVTIWGGMKSSAEIASQEKDRLHDEGGAHYVASKLRDFCQRNAGQHFELHAVGHSAGSIFLAHFLDATHQLGVPSFKSVHLLAPAIRVDLFKRLFIPLLGSAGIDQLSLFTMHRDLERDDNCGTVYRKSLLYLIYYALEPEKEEAILGLEECLRRDPQLQQVFGLNSTRLTDAQVVFSPTPLDIGKSACRSTTHGGFDDDGATMDSVLRRITDKQDADPIKAYPRTPGGGRGFDQWRNQIDWPQRIDPGFRSGEPVRAGGAALAANRAISTGMAGPGRRRALCVGINQYPDRPLNGCVADTQDWAQTFSELGFETTLMLDAEATHEAIVRRLTELVKSSAAGDVLAFQYAGHGTQFVSANGSEGRYGKPDQALVPFDYQTSPCVMDDELWDIFKALPSGVSLSCFLDCCNSGTATRLAAGSFGMGAGNAVDERQRFMIATDDMRRKYEAFRATRAASRALSPAQGLDEDRHPIELMKNIAFAACTDEQSAWESNGRGDFTVRATKVLRAGITHLTNEQFNDAVISAFGKLERQNPQLDCPAASRSMRLLAPLVEGASTSASVASLAEVRNALLALAARLQ